MITCLPAFFFPCIWVYIRTDITLFSFFRHRSVGASIAKAYIYIIATTGQYTEDAMRELLPNHNNPSPPCPLPD